MLTRQSRLADDRLFARMGVSFYIRLQAWITEDYASQGLAQQPLLALKSPSGMLILSARVHSIAKGLSASSHCDLPQAIAVQGGGKDYDECSAFLSSHLTLSRHQASQSQC